MSVGDRIVDAVKAAVLLEARVASLGDGLAALARDVRDIDKRLVRVETVLDLGLRPPPRIADQGS